MDEKIPVDAARPIALQLRTPVGVKTVYVRFPTDEQWAERQRRRNREGLTDSACSRSARRS
jgi:hypothetical protein